MCRYCRIYINHQAVRFCWDHIHFLRKFTLMSELGEHDENICIISHNADRLARRRWKLWHLKIVLMHAQSIVKQVVLVYDMNMIWTWYELELNLLWYLTWFIKMLSASSWVVRRSGRGITCPCRLSREGPLISTGTGSGPVNIRGLLTRSPLWAIKSSTMRSTSCSLLIVTPSRTDWGGRGWDKERLKILEEVFVRLIRQACFVLSFLLYLEMIDQSK